MTSSPELSVCIPTLNIGSERTTACLQAIRDTLAGESYEIVVVENGSPPQGVTAPINAAFRAARGRCLALCSDDVLVQRGWWPPLRKALDSGASVVFPTTVRGVMRYDFAAWCFAMTRTAYERFGVQPGEFFDPEMMVWCQDMDLLARMKAQGHSPLCIQGSHILHGEDQYGSSTILDPEHRSWVLTQIEEDCAVYTAKMERLTGARQFQGVMA